MRTGFDSQTPYKFWAEQYMALPELPKKYNRKESKIDGRVSDWLFKNHPKSCLYEVKMVGGKLALHQRKLLKSLGTTGKFHYKFPDGARRTPLDGVILKDADAVLCWCNEKGVCVCIVNNKEQFNIKV